MKSNLKVQFLTNIQQSVDYWTAKLYNKVIITMMIGPLDDYTYCARSAFTHLGLWPKLYDYSMHHFTTSQFILKCALFSLFTLSSTSNRLTKIWKADFSTPIFGVFGRRWAHSIIRLGAPISSRLTHTLGGVLPYCHRVRRPASSSSSSLFVQSEAVVYPDNGFT